ncbi:MAG: monooxygenase [Gordonia sp. (in: high G+C Gram-positive bacteria)]|uniref:monooxygenase n=1 Tax=Gordonia sp. (in: high G+C Gram-positive bacteria) TaxID=84139 RepID=UPI0039E6D8E0
MAHLVIFDFPSTGPFGAEAAAAYDGLARDIAAEDGLVWKVWTEDAAANTAGGVYLFTDRDVADRYIAKHTERLGSFGITDITTARHDVNDGLSSVTHAVLASRA